MMTHDEIKKGSVVQFKANWGQEPTLFNTAEVKRIAKDRSWADVSSMFGSKRVPDPDKHLKLIDQPIVVRYNL